MTKSFHSQFGEDRLLYEFFGRKTTGTCVEVGANDGVRDSNTRFFEDLGWSCVLVEPNPELCREIRLTRTSRLFECAASSAPGTMTLHIARGAERSHGVSALGERGAQHVRSFGFETVPVEVCVRTLDSLLEEAEVVAPLDFVTIDVEGHEIDVLRGFDLERWRPEFLILEDNENFGNDLVRDYLRERGWVPVRRTGVNDWFVSVGSRWDERTARMSYSKARRAARLRARLANLPGAKKLHSIMKSILGAK